MDKTVGRHYELLLITNRDSDNVGDQIIEATDIALIKAVMKNLKISDYKIQSSAAGIISKDYTKTMNSELLEGADKKIKNADIIIFGGAPMFNYLYQVFYKRTATIIELASKYNKPVIFSAIGIERYDSNNPKCQELKKALNSDCVKQITTRDGINELEKYKENKNMVIARVADPAVFSVQVMKDFMAEKADTGIKKIGLFIFRANGFKDNKINFTKDDAVKLWKSIIEELKKRAYDYEILTSGHFGDEAFMDYLIRKHVVDEKKCVFNINTPEDLISRISSYDGVISCRLHPSIISYSLDIPSVGIIWNSNVKSFYQCIGYEDRSIEVGKHDAAEIVANLESAMHDGISKDEEYLMSVYNYIFTGIKNSLQIEGIVKPYDYCELVNNIPAFKGTSDKEKGLKLKRKFRRAYDSLNKRAYNIEILKKQVESMQYRKGLKRIVDALTKHDHTVKRTPAEGKIKGDYGALTKQNDYSTEPTYKMHYHSGIKGDEVVVADGWKADMAGDIKRLPSKALELKLDDAIKNTGETDFLQIMYKVDGRKFKGWRVRFKVEGKWIWCLEGDTFCTKETFDSSEDKMQKIFYPGDKIPCFPFGRVSTVVAEAEWSEQ